MKICTYNGPLPRGRVMLASGERPFTRGTPIELDDADAASLDGDWATKAPPKNKAKADADAPTPEEG